MHTVVLIPVPLSLTTRKYRKETYKKFNQLYAECVSTMEVFSMFIINSKEKKQKLSAPFPYFFLCHITIYFYLFSVNVYFVLFHVFEELRERERDPGRSYIESKVDRLDVIHF